MTVAPTTYTEAEAQLNEVTVEVSNVLNSVRTAIARINAAHDRMGILAQAAPAGYLSLISYINTQAAANPADPTWTNIKNRSDKIVGDFTSINSYINNLITAINEV